MYHIFGTLSSVRTKKQRPVRSAVSYQALQPDRLPRAGGQAGPDTRLRYKSAVVENPYIKVQLIITGYYFIRCSVEINTVKTR